MAGLMKAVRKTRPQAGSLEMTEIPIPEPAPGEVLIQVSAASICGTDLHLLHWDDWAKKHAKRPPFTMGHELCGKVVEIRGSCGNLKPGDFISAESHVLDLGGEFARAGLAHVDPHSQTIGVQRDGAFASYIALPHANARPNPPDMPVRVAVLKENFGNAVHVADLVDLHGRDVLMTGCGPVSQMALLVAEARGVRRVFVSEINGYRRARAKDLGAHHVIDPRGEDGRERLVQEVLDLTDQRGVDVLWEMSGNETALVQGLELLRPGGHAIAFGLFKSKSVPLDFNDLIIGKGITVHGVIGRRLWDTWNTMEELLHDGIVDLSPIVTHEFPLSRFQDAFDTMEKGECGKVMMTP